MVLVSGCDMAQWVIEFILGTLMLDFPTPPYCLFIGLPIGYHSSKQMKLVLFPLFSPICRCAAYVFSVSVILLDWSVSWSFPLLKPSIAELASIDEKHSQASKCLLE